MFSTFIADDILPLSACATLSPRDPFPCFLNTVVLMCSGSYDESVRIWDLRNPRDPLSTIPTGGGLWRLKWHPNPERGELLLAACMHAGVRVLNAGMGAEGTVPGDVANSEGSATGGGAGAVVAKYTRHESMAYGVDWCRIGEAVRGPRPLIASCSFYDRLFCLWRITLPPLNPSRAQLDSNHDQSSALSI